MFFPPQRQFYVNLPNPAPPRLPIPIENKPKKREGWPIKPKPKVSKKTPPKKVAKTKKDTKTPSKAKTPSVDYKIKQPKDVSQKVKRSKISKSPCVIRIFTSQGNNSPSAPPRDQNPPDTPSGPSGGRRSRSRSPIGTNDVPEEESNNGEDEWESEEEEFGGGRVMVGMMFLRRRKMTVRILVPRVLNPMDQNQRIRLNNWPILIVLLVYAKLYVNWSGI